MALTFAQKSDVRRHLRYPVAGLIRVSPAGGTLASGAASWRWFNSFGFLEWKLNNLNPDEEARLIGSAYGAIACIGNNPNPGDTITVTFSGGPLASPVSVVTTAIVNDTPLVFINRIAANVQLNPVLQAANFFSIAPYGSGPFSQNAVALPEVAFTNPQGYNLSISTTSSQLSPILTGTGAMLGPTTNILNYTNNLTTINGYLPILDFLEGQWAGSSDNLSTWAAANWVARKTELKERQEIYNSWCFRMGEFLGTAFNPYPARGLERGSGMRSII